MSCVTMEGIHFTVVNITPALLRSENRAGKEAQWSRNPEENWRGVEHVLSWKRVDKLEKEDADISVAEN